jgi:hypothetical protein
VVGCERAGYTWVVELGLKKGGPNVHKIYQFKGYIIAFGCAFRLDFIRS